MSIALYHFHTTQVKRSAGQSVIAAAAYRAGEKLYSDRYGETSDYTHKGGVICSEILLPSHAPLQYADRQTLWNAVEEVERGKKAQLAYSFDIALQNEFSLAENIALARQFLLKEFVSRGMIVDFAVHQPDKGEGIENPHFHVLCPIRPLKENGDWDAKQHREYVTDENGSRIRDEAGNDMFNAVATTDWGEPETLEEWRKAWANLCNAKFAEKGLSVRIDHRSYERQGLDILPTVHIGPAVQQMEKRGVRTNKGDFNRWVRATNTLMKNIREKISALLKLLKDMRTEMSKPHEPTLAEMLGSYYADRSAGAWSQKAKLGNLKNFSEAINYLSVNRLYTLSDLEIRLESYRDRDAHSKASLDAKTVRIKEIDRLLQLADFYHEGKPVHDKLNSIKFKKAREKYAGEQEKALHFFYLAQRKLKLHFGENGKLPIAEWKKEQAQLTAEYTAECEAYKPLAADVKKLWQIRYAIERAQHEMQRETNRAIPNNHNQER